MKNYEVVEFQPRSFIATVLDSVAYCYVLLPFLPCYSNPQLSFNTRSFAHLGVANLRPIISTYRMGSTAHPGISRICPIIPTTRSGSLPSPGSYCVAFHSHFLLLLASHNISSRVAQGFYLPPPGATMPLSFDSPPCSPSRLRIFQIPVVTLPTASHFPFISLYRSSLTAFLPLPALLLPQASPISRQLSVVIVSP